MFKLHPNLSDPIVCLFHLAIELHFLNSGSYSTVWKILRNFLGFLELYFLLDWIFCLSLACYVFHFYCCNTCPYLLFHFFSFAHTWGTVCRQLSHSFIERDIFKRSSHHIKELFVFFLLAPFWRLNTHISWVPPFCSLREYWDCGKLSL